jgi:hypothetical protein
MIKLRKMRFVGYVLCLGRIEIRNSEGMRIFGKQCIDNIG